MEQITWFMDLDSYTLEQIEKLSLVVENIDYGIYKKLIDYLVYKNYY